jgi:gliding motility-associated-like protein
LIWQEISNQQDYQPNLGKRDYGEYFFRRVVSSGKCVDTFSNVASIRFDRQPLLSDFEIRINDKTGDQVGNNALRYLFIANLEMIQLPDVGIGTWSSIESQKEKLVFSSVDEPKTTVSDLEFGMNTVIWKVTNGVCPPVSVPVNIEVTDVIIYNGFSPNGDGKNECFVIEGGENASSGELIIYDRYNNMVFKSSMDSHEIRNCTCWWDGRSSSGKELPSGTYFYHLILNKEKEKKGYVVLKRK